MNPNKPPQHHADKPTFDDEVFWESMEIEATLREWNRKHIPLRPASGESVEEPPGTREHSSLEAPRRPWWRLLLFWRRGPA